MYRIIMSHNRFALLDIDDDDDNIPVNCQKIPPNIVQPSVNNPVNKHVPNFWDECLRSNIDNIERKHDEN